MEYYKSQEDNDNLYYFAKLNAFLTRSLINIKELETAINLLNNPEYLKRCDKNIVLRAEREYLFGIIAEDYNKSVLEPAVEYYNKALKLIENQSILELTWEINFALAKFYFERGNYKRFYEYSIITKSLINFISSKISSKRTKGKYLNSFKRKDAIETLEKYEKLI